MMLCRHNNLLLIKKSGKRLRCRHCYLTIRSDELESNFCPECQENDGIRRMDFEEIVESESDDYTYRCEECGILIKFEQV